MKSSKVFLKKNKIEYDKILKKEAKRQLEKGNINSELLKKIRCRNIKIEVE